LKAGIFAQSGVRGKIDGGLIGCFLIVLFALDRRTEIDHFARLLINQQDVLVSMRFLLATVVGSLLGVVLGTLPSSLRAVNEQIGGALVDQLAVGNSLAIALGRHFQIGQCAPQHRQQPMNPVMGLRLA